MTQQNPPHILVIEARFYEQIADELWEGAEAHLREKGATWEKVTVSGALEIPQVLAAAINSGCFRQGVIEKPFQGCVALGCVIRGETSHYDIVAVQSARALMELAILHYVPLGNGILTVENKWQALVRASVNEKNKGRDAVQACLDVIAVAQNLDRR